MNKFDMRKIKFTVVKDPDKHRALMGIEYVDDDAPLTVAYDISDSAYFTHDYLDRLRDALIEIQIKVEGGIHHVQIDDKSQKGIAQKRICAPSGEKVPDKRPRSCRQR